MVFSPKVTFEAVVRTGFRDEFDRVRYRDVASTYVAGLQYTAWTPELRKAARKWHKKGLVSILTDAASSSVSGRGVVDKE